jgi:RNA polymerase sigma-70 factor (ECF subfamily)
MSIFSEEHQRFTQHYNAYKDKIYSYVFYRLNTDPHIAEDLTSEIFLKAYDAYESYDETYAFSTWIYRIARNTLIDHFRKNKPEAVAFEESYHDTKDSTATPDFLFDQTANLDSIRNTVSSLPALQQDVIILKYLEDATTAQMAQQLDQTPSNVRQALSRGLKTLRARMISIITLLFFFPWL